MRRFGATPAGRLRRAYLHLPHSITSSGSAYIREPPSVFVTHVPAKSGLDFLTCGGAARHAGDGGLLGGHGPGDDHEGSSRHLLITKDHARCHHRPRTPSLTNSTRTSSPTSRKHRRSCWPRCSRCPIPENLGVCGTDCR